MKAGFKSLIGIVLWIAFSLIFLLKCSSGNSITKQTNYNITVNNESTMPAMLKNFPSILTRPENIEIKYKNVFDRVDITVSSINGTSEMFFDNYNNDNNGEHTVRNFSKSVFPQNSDETVNFDAKKLSKTLDGAILEKFTNITAQNNKDVNKNVIADNQNLFNYNDSSVQYNNERIVHDMNMLIDLFLLNDQAEKSKPSCLFLKTNGSFIDEQKNQYNGILNKIRAVIDERTFRKKSVFKRFYNQLLLGDNHIHSETISKLVSLDVIQEMFNNLNSSSVILNNDSMEDIERFARSFDNFLQTTKDFQFLPIFNRISNFEGYKYKIRNDDEREFYIPENQKNHTIEVEKDLNPPSIFIHNTTVGENLKQKIHVYTDFWNELDQWIRKYNAIDLSRYTLTQCNVIYSKIIQIISDFNFAMCLNDNHILLSLSSSHIKRFALKKCYKESLEFALMTVLIDKKPVLLYSSLRFDDNPTTKEKDITSNNPNNSDVDASIIAFEGNKTEKPLERSLDEQTKIPSARILFLIAKADPNYRLFLYGLKTICTDAKIEKFDVEKLFNKAETEKVKIALGLTNFESTMKYLNDFIEEKSNNYAKLCNIVTELLDVISHNDLSTNEEYNSDMDQYIKSENGYTHQDLCAIHDFIHFIIDSVRYLKLNQTHEEPYNLENNYYNFIDHKLASIRYLLIENNENSLGLLYQLMLRFENNFSHFMIDFYDNNLEKKCKRNRLLSRSDLKIFFNLHLFAQILDDSDILMLKNDFAEIENDPETLKRVSYINSVSVNGKKYVVYKNMIERVCIANRSNHPLCCAFERII
ncbi:hypothetical protein EDEG_03215 [Edhazardia aedis USNM 41457]|uniref:Fam-f protein n=1 Tax=Edhazardia aedis (strain USNM 41457) TaxID=1003232 RepID=J9D3D3_EDHAE|nr:hypothetical protein EDEG_03215 [Edhazardia aedis USNM 41457]|eukprot:EJW02356.1 hypothetical protein EDEG_03215 [Edhazardia aedis USNM 41457]